MRARKTDIAVVGAGPVGLTLAHLLAARGFEIAVIEKDAAPWAHSRAIGLHPVSLEVLDGVGVAQALIDAGVVVGGGRALTAKDDELGRLDFDALPGPFPFILSLPQQQTERVLEASLRTRPSAHVMRSHRLVSLEATENASRLGLEGEHSGVEARLVVGCDGKGSFVRGAAGIDYEGAPYPDRFVMGDFEDNTPYGVEAAIFLHAAGLIESFPLPGGRRRWVVKVEHDERDPHLDDLRWRLTPESNLRPLIEALVAERVGHSLVGVPSFMVSRFGVQHYLANQLYRGRVVLAGDAAHVVSPIGGQGMNLGILDAARLADALGTPAILDDESSLDRALSRYQRITRRIARKATRRSAFFMQLGQKRARPGLRNTLIKLMISPLLAGTSARLFTMRGLSWTPV